jgi:uncharacterized membrane protein
MVGLGFIPGGVAGAAFAVSADGKTVVGLDNITITGNYTQEAFIWTAAGGMHPLGFLPGMTDSRATAVSADGSYVVGMSGAHPFLVRALRHGRS